MVDQDIAARRSGLQGTPDVRFREFSSLNHLFIAGGGVPGPVDYGQAASTEWY